MIKYEDSPNCNRCSPRATSFSSRCNGTADESCCPFFVPPKDTWTLFELALTHPQGLHDVLQEAKIWAGSYV